MKSLVIGDPHFKKNNVKECRTFIQKIISCIEKFKPDFVVVLGDLLDSHNVYHETPFNLAVQFLFECSQRVRTFLLIGNHDFASNQEFLSTRHPFNALKQWENITIVDKIVGWHSNGFDFVFVPYVYPGRFLEALNSNDDVMFETADCIFAHQEFYGCKMGAITSTVGDRWESNYPPVISGHIHSAQHVEPNVWYTGTPFQHSFGDNENKRVWLVDFSESKESILKFPFKIQTINLKLPTKKIYYFDSIDEIKSFDPKENEKAKLTIKCTAEEYKSFIDTTEYNELKQKGVQLNLKTDRDVDDSLIQEKKKAVNSVDTYSTIFYKLVEKEENPQLLETYKELSLE